MKGRKESDEEERKEGKGVMKEGDKRRNEETKENEEERKEGRKEGRKIWEVGIKE